MRVFLPVGDGPVGGLLTAAQHGEEADTALLVRRLLELTPASETRWAVIPVLNPDGLLAGTRQNAAGVDLNRNFPASTWEPDPTFTYPPGIDPEIRVVANRTNRSSPGAHPGSEPETRALTALIERLEPPLVVDLHSPLELILARGDVPSEVIDGLAGSASLPAQDEFEGHCVRERSTTGCSSATRPCSCTRSSTRVCRRSADGTCLGSGRCCGARPGSPGGVSAGGGIRRS